jgi:citrate lyase subunit gamma (acyl carrier protein)
MAQLKQPAQAGTLESSDILIMVAPAPSGSGISIELTSPTLQRFGRQMKEVIERTLQEEGVENAQVQANDKGALDCTIVARVKTAVLRATQ